MRYAIPVADGMLCQHFGHCKQFAFVDVQGDRITGTTYHDPPMHEPGVLPRWLNEQEVNIVIAGGMGQKAQQFFSQYGIDCIIGAEPEVPEHVVGRHLDGSLVTGANLCDH